VTETEILEATLFNVELERDRLQSENERLRKRLRLRVVGSAIEEICGTLPDGWEIRLELERGAGVVRLLSPSGYVDFPTNHECLADELRDALQHSQEYYRDIGQSLGGGEGENDDN